MSTLYGPQYTARAFQVIYMGRGLAGLRELEGVIYNDSKMAAGEGSTSSLELELKFGGTTHASDVHTYTNAARHSFCVM